MLHDHVAPPHANKLESKVLHRPHEFVAGYNWKLRHFRRLLLAENDLQHDH